MNAANNLMCGFIQFIPTILCIYVAFKYHQECKIFKVGFIVAGILVGLTSVLYFIESI